MANSKRRVPAHTSRDANQRIKEETEQRLRFFEEHKDRIDKRLKDLDKEWDVERAIEANASALAFIGVALGFFLHPYWLALPALVTAFLFQHAVQGWCPPVPVLRRLGFRTAYEIQEESQALKVIRGDFRNVSRAETALRVASA